MNAQEPALFEELVNHLHKIAEESRFVRLNLQRHVCCSNVPRDALTVWRDTTTGDWHVLQDGDTFRLVAEDDKNPLTYDHHV